VLQAHFVVRDPTPTTTTAGGAGSGGGALLGFCATYFYRASGTGTLGALIVDPRHRRRRVGRELHARAIRALLLREGARRFQLGARLPSAFPGVPRGGGGEAGAVVAEKMTTTTTRRGYLSWFANMGWNTSATRPLCSLAAPLDGICVGAGASAAAGGWQAALIAALRASGAGFDLVFDWEHAGGVLDLVRAEAGAPAGTAEVFELALMDPGGWFVGPAAAAAAHPPASADGASSTTTNNAAGGGGCGVIRARRRDDGTVIGAAAVFLAGSRLADHVPALRAAAAQPASGVAAPVVAAGQAGREALARGLVLLGMRYLKQQGCASCVLDCVSGYLLPLSSSSGW
jgi:beta-N-acetylhexosaminidase